MIGNTPDAHAPSRPKAGGPRALLVVAAALIGVLILATLLWTNRPSQPIRAAHLGFALPPGQTLTVNRRAVSISPDGTRIVYSADGGLFLRSLSDFDAHPIRGADPGITPVFRLMDSRWPFTPIPRSSASASTVVPAVTLCQVGVAPSSMAWTDGNILYSDGGNAILRVSTNGGKPDVIVDLKGSEDLAFGPQLLPDGDTLLLSLVKRTSAAIGRWDVSEVVMQSLKTGLRKRLVERGSDAQYVPTGHIVYVADTTLFAVPFDVRSLTVTGGAVPVIDGINLGATFGIGRTAHFAFSKSGSLVYVPGPVSGGQHLLLFDRQGGSETLGLPPDWYNSHGCLRTGSGSHSALPTVKRPAFRFTSYQGRTRRGASHSAATTASRFGPQTARASRFSPTGTAISVFSGSRRMAARQSVSRKLNPAPCRCPSPGLPHGDVLLFSVTKDFVSSLSMLSPSADRRVVPIQRCHRFNAAGRCHFSPEPPVSRIPGSAAVSR